MTSLLSWLLFPMALIRELARFLKDEPRPLGRCPGCLTTVFDDDAHVRYRGEVWHAEPCIEISAHALERQLKRDRR